MNPAKEASTKNGMPGRPGTIAKSVSTPQAMKNTRGLRKSWDTRSEPRLSPSEAARVTIMPVAVEMSSAAICPTRPSPTVSSV